MVVLELMGTGLDFLNKMAVMAQLQLHGKTK
jgi:hypothetical protein